MDIRELRFFVSWGLPKVLGYYNNNNLNVFSRFLCCSSSFDKLFPMKQCRPAKQRLTLKFSQEWGTWDDEIKSFRTTNIYKRIQWRNTIVVLRICILEGTHYSWINKNHEATFGKKTIFLIFYIAYCFTILIKKKIWYPI